MCYTYMHLGLNMHVISVPHLASIVGSLVYIGPYRGGICHIFRVTSEVVYSMQSSFRLADYNAHNMHHAHQNLPFLFACAPLQTPSPVCVLAPMHLCTSTPYNRERF